MFDYEEVEIDGDDLRVWDKPKGKWVYYHIKDKRQGQWVYQQVVEGHLVEVSRQLEEGNQHQIAPGGGDSTEV